MSEWRRLAIELFPEYRSEFLLDFPENTIYDVFFDLLPLAHEFHKSSNVEGLTRVYEYAEWCLHNRSEDISNAASVAFYEHLVDDNISLRAIPDWVKPKDFQDLLPLFELQLEKEPEKLVKLIADYNRINKTTITSNKV